MEHPQYRSCSTWPDAYTVARSNNESFDGTVGDFWKEAVKYLTTEFLERADAGIERGHGVWVDACRQELADRILTETADE